MCADFEKPAMRDIFEPRSKYSATPKSSYGKDFVEDAFPFASAAVRAGDDAFGDHADIRPIAVFGDERLPAAACLPNRRGSELLAHCAFQAGKRGQRLSWCDAEFRSVASPVRCVSRNCQTRLAIRRDSTTKRSGRSCVILAESARGSFSVMRVRDRPMEVGRVLYGRGRCAPRWEHYAGQFPQIEPRPVTFSAG